ncbi:hypothetical protein OPT61_g8698 [Boeremia exigua]|uniref:Uncharacterized protein n=1 Tax=Boeremia exigua TaxID=749465 RepID=A0ACC2HY28_9PLEO|nr:hypothetical protein OPT61_g8698 [Boeremia exigua]
MAEPPDKLNPSVKAFGPIDGFAATAHKDGAHSAATPAFTEADNAKASDIRKLRLALAASQLEVAALTKKLLCKEQEFESLNNPPPSMMALLDTTMRNKLSSIKELSEGASKMWERAAATDRLAATTDAETPHERQMHDALTASIVDATQIESIDPRTEVRDLADPARTAVHAAVVRTIALCLKDEDAIQCATEALMTKYLLNRKAEKANRYEVLKDLDHGSKEYRSRELVDVDAATPPEERKYALSDPEIQDLLKEYRLMGYLECARSFDLRSAARQKVDGFDIHQCDYLFDVKHRNNTLQEGIEAGKLFGWRAMCHAFDKPGWDTSLNPHNWRWQEFWTAFLKPSPGSFWDGVEQGFAQAEEKFKARQAKEAEEASFQTVAPDFRSTDKHASPTGGRTTTSKGQSKDGLHREKSRHEQSRRPDDSANAPKPRICGGGLASGAQKASPKATVPETARAPSSPVVQPIEHSLKNKGPSVSSRACNPHDEPVNNLPFPSLLREGDRVPRSGFAFGE